MTRGEVWWVRFGPGEGGEIRKRRPAIIVSNDSANRHLNRVQVVPLTRNVRRVFPSEAVVTIRGGLRKAMADQIATASKERLDGRVGKLSTQDMESVEQAILIQLGITRPG